MSSLGMIITVLTTGLTEAIAKDEQLEVEGHIYYMGSGDYGPNVTAWIKELATEIDSMAYTIGD